MADENQASTEMAQNRTMRAIPVTPSDGMERPDGLAFDVEKGADLSGVPVDDQFPRNAGAVHTEETVRERGEGVGLAVPGNPDQASEKDRDEQPSDR